MTAWTLVLGGSGSLGHEICLQLAKAGHKVIVHYHLNKERAEKIAAECGNALSVQGDFSSDEDIQAFVDTCQKQGLIVKYLVYATGNYVVGSGLKTPLDQWKSLFQINTFAPVALIQAFAKTIVERKGAIITFGVAGIGKNRANCYNTAYVNAKESLWQATRSIAKELAAEGVRVNMISPGHMEGSQDLESFRSTQPSGKPVKKAAVANLVLFLLSEQAEEMTGQNIEVTGGAFL